MEDAILAYMKLYPVALKGIRELSWGARSVGYVSLTNVEASLKVLVKKNKIEYFRKVDYKTKTVTEGYSLK